MSRDQAIGVFIRAVYTGSPVNWLYSGYGNSEHSLMNRLHACSNPAAQTNRGNNAGDKDQRGEAGG